MAHAILLIEDDAAFRKSVRRVFESNGYAVSEASTGKDGLLAARERSPDLVVLDLVLPGLKGTEVCAALKGDPATAGLPVLILTGNDRDGQEIACLDIGADDYLTKPVKTELLLARCRALLRRLGRDEAPEEPLGAGGLTLHFGRKLVVAGGKEFRHLTPKEFGLLYELARHSPEPVDREALYRSVWGSEPPSAASLKTVDVHVRRIRLKLGWEGDERLRFVSGRGYLLAPK